MGPAIMAVHGGRYGVLRGGGIIETVQAQGAVAAREGLILPGLKGPEAVVSVEIGIALDPAGSGRSDGNPIQAAVSLRHDRADLGAEVGNILGAVLECDARSASVIHHGPALGSALSARAGD